MVAILLNNIKNVVKKVPNPHLAKFPLLTDVLKKMDISEDITKLTYGSLFCDNIVEYENYYPVVGKKRIYKVLVCSVGNDGMFSAQVKTVGVILFQDIHAEKKIILKVNRDNQKSEKISVVTGYFDQNYFLRFPETLFFKDKKVNRHWNLEKTSLFSIDMEKLEPLRQVKAHKNCEFKVK